MNKNIDTVGLINALLAGKPHSEISAEFGVKRWQLCATRKVLGMAPAKKGPRGPRDKNVDSIEKAKAMKAAGLTYRQIGLALDVSGQCVQQWLLPPKAERPKYNPDIPCADCGTKDKTLQCHHTDYVGGPIIFLCTSCHTKRTRTGAKKIK